MAKKIAEVMVLLNSGGVVMEYVKADSADDLQERLNKMRKGKNMNLGAVTIPQKAISGMAFKMHGVN